MTRKRNLTDEEDRLWRHVMQGIVPADKSVTRASNRVDGSGNGPVRAGKALKPGRHANKVQAPLTKKTGTAMPPVIRHVTDGAPLPPKRASTADFSHIDRKEKQRVLRGKVEIDAKIDLHGMRQNEAHSALVARVTGARLQGARVLLVVTGKGASKGGPKDGSEPFWARGGGVLKESVPRWLREDPLRQMIFSVQQAHQRHGGGGALYVFLKRLR